jgi:hypothetical protein
MTDAPATLWVLVFTGVLVVALLATWLSWTAGRLDRLHLRCEAADEALQSQLSRRSAVAVELAVGSLGDPASSLLPLEAAHHARDAVGPDKWLAESELTRTLRLVELPSEFADPLVAELRDAAGKVAVARRIHNDLVASTRALRSRRRVRWFRLAGHAKPPGMINFDDAVR